jgi:transcription elongation factor GreA
MERIPITRDGYVKLKDELKRLKTIERKEVIEDLRQARSHGDLSENAEYDAAKEKQAFVEGKIAELETRLSKLDIIDIGNITSDTVTFGAIVEIENLDTAEKRKYKIVGPDESDIKDGKISVMSPIARALIGKKVGDEVAVSTPSGEVEYEVIKISYE